MNRLQRGNALISVMSALAIIGILAAIYFIPKGGEPTRKDGKGTTTIGSALWKSRDTQCKNNLSQIRQLIYVQTSASGDDETKPASLNEVSGLPQSMRTCPIGKERYTYSPGEATVACPHPGHEKY